jgi:hypothetical protein
MKIFPADLFVGEDLEFVLDLLHAVISDIVNKSTCSAAPERSA